MSISAPKINNTFFCIASRDETLLSSVVYSHVNSPDHYTLLFGFSSVTKSKDTDDINQRDEHQISRTNAIKTNIELLNTLRRIGGCNYLILIGLTDNQKSFITFLHEYNVIDISSYSDVNTFLSPITLRKSISCKTDQVFKGLQLASSKNLAIIIDEDTDDIVIEPSKKNGLIIVENKYLFETLVATNYAISIKADLLVIDPYNFHEKEFLKHIEDWREEVKNGLDQRSLKELSALMNDRIEDIVFTDYNFVTFFTIGAPYSLIINNIIPCTYVGLKLSPDFFIFNNIYFQDNYNIGSGIVFSPRFFSREETDFVIKKLEQYNYHVTPLIKENATAINFDYYVKELPFNILHLCSHGNQTEGHLIKEKYKDQHGNEHIFEYFQAFSLALDPGKFNEKGEPLIKVMIKTFPRKLNGHAFRTEEFKKQNYPPDIFPKMFRTVPVKENQISSQKLVLENSHEIACYRFSHFAIFSHLSANRHSPLVFNNTCWSAYETKNHLLGTRARAYIGTLWAVNNDIALKTAEDFYKKIFNKTVMEAFQESLVHSIGTNNQNIYVFYGLHFTMFKKAKSLEFSKIKLVEGLMENIRAWKKNYDDTKNADTKDSILDNIKWNRNIITKYFMPTLIKIIGPKGLKDFFKNRLGTKDKN